MKLINVILSGPSFTRLVSKGVFFFLVLGVWPSLAEAQEYEIPGAQQQPAWVFPIYFEDANGELDTIYLGYDPESTTGGGWPNYSDTVFGEVYFPADSTGFRVYLGTNPWWFGSDSILKTVVTPQLNQLNVQLRDCQLPLTMRWDSQLSYSDSLPFLGQDPLPRMEIVLWPADLIANFDEPEGNLCGFTEPIILSDTSTTYPVCTFSDSILLDSWGCPGCLFSGDFDLWFRAWTGGWVSVKESPVEVDFSLTPNPVVDRVQINTNYNLDYSIRIFDLLGNLVYSNGTYHGTARVDLTSLAPGIYLFQVHSSTDLISTQIKLLKPK